MQTLIHFAIIIFHFLGSIQLAITLIAIAAIVVIAGTIIESKTGSHLLAAQWTYAHPIFLLLLSLFFTNILVSALRRWPFQKRHIPFLLTHLGLLMVIGGTIIKNQYGIQGELIVWEGGEERWLSIPHTRAIKIQASDDRAEFITLNTAKSQTYQLAHFPDLECEVIGYAPHVNLMPTPFAINISPDAPPIKIEERRPAIVIELREKDRKQTLALAYDRSGKNQKRHAFNGRYFVNFQPFQLELPYRLKMLQARQIHYPHSQKVYSYESDLLISNDKNAQPLEHTLSMNRVYETEDGYRFYLAGIGHSPNGKHKCIQVTVNRDPVKYALTYPGAFLIFIGSISLFWMQSQRGDH